jgi:hypothetical protein
MPWDRLATTERGVGVEVGRKLAGSAPPSKLPLLSRRQRIVLRGEAGGQLAERLKPIRAAACLPLELI